MNRKICVVTGTRAEFGLLRWLMAEIQAAPELSLQLIVTGMHLSPEFGSTYREIEEAGFAIDARVEMLLGADSDTAVSKSMGLGLIGFADAYERLKPDVVVVLGDRFEIFSAASAALIAGIPIAHLHGGETTEGAFDEAIRHSITKMSHLHFVGAADYRRRVIQLGEHPGRVFNVGGLGIDAIQRIKLLGREELETSIGCSLGEKSLLITFHPVTLDKQQSSVDQMLELLSAMHELANTRLIFTMPNADTGGRELAAMVDDFVRLHPNACVFSSLGQLRYLSCMKLVDGVVGNSSSGIAEAPAMGVGTVNIGDRQKGRLQAHSVINCPARKDRILEAVSRLYSVDFRSSLNQVTNPYGNGGACKEIVRVLSEFSLEGILKKSFHDIPGVPDEIMA